MNYVIALLVTLAIVVIILYFVWARWSGPSQDGNSTPGEQFRSCRGCDYHTNESGEVAINPYIWPYSATECVGNVTAKGKMVGLIVDPLQAANAPDHVIQTN
jgi:hypothetical protein